MKERPILYSAPMVRAILDDTKTQTRRTAKLTANGHVKEPRGHRRWHPADPKATLACPYGQPGDRLWVRETFQPLLADGFDFHAANWETGKGYAPRYVATDGAIEWIDPDDNISSASKPSIHMPRWASRILLEVTGVRVERLQDISEADCIAEGIQKTPHGFWSTYGQGDCEGTYSPRTSFRCLWESINSPGSWDANPRVWAIEFKRLTA